MTTAESPRRGPGRPRGLAHGQTRTEVLDAAVRLFAISGYRGTALGEIAAQAGLTTAGLLHHFSSKERLLIEVLQRRDELDMIELDANLDEPIWNLLDSLVVLVRRNSERPGLVSLFATMAGEAIDPRHPAHAWLQERMARLVGALHAAFEKGKADGLVRREAPSPFLARSLIALMDGLQTQWLLADEQASGHVRVGTPETVGPVHGRANMADDLRCYIDSLKTMWRIEPPSIAAFL